MDVITPATGRILNQPGVPGTRWGGGGQVDQSGGQVSAHVGGRSIRLRQSEWPTLQVAHPLSPTASFMTPIHEHLPVYFNYITAL